MKLITVEEEPSTMTWNAVDNGVPDNDQLVLFVTHRDLFYLGYCEKKIDWYHKISSVSLELIEDKVTHWAALRYPLLNECAYEKASDKCSVCNKVINDDDSIEWHDIHEEKIYHLHRKCLQKLKDKK